MERVRLKITGMTCEHCARTIAKQLEKDPGVQEVRIDWEKGLGEVVFDPSLTDVEKLLRNPAFTRHYSAKVAA